MIKHEIDEECKECKHYVHLRGDWFDEEEISCDYDWDCPYLDEEEADDDVQH
jgi:hypothetical protein